MSWFKKILGTVAGTALGSIAGPTGAMIGASIGSGIDSANSAEDSAQAGYDYQTYMAGNKYQLMVSDLKKAGLNPLIAVNGGSAGTGGASAVSSAYDYSPAISSGATSALQASRLRSELESLEAGIQKTRSEALAIDQTRKYEAELQPYKVLGQIASNQYTTSLANSAISQEQLNRSMIDSYKATVAEKLMKLDYFKKNPEQLTRLFLGGSAQAGDILQFGNILSSNSSKSIVRGNYAGPGLPNINMSVGPAGGIRFDK